MIVAAKSAVKTAVILRGFCDFLQEFLNIVIPQDLVRAVIVAAKSDLELKSITNNAEIFCDNIQYIDCNSMYIALSVDIHPASSSEQERRK